MKTHHLEATDDLLGRIVSILDGARGQVVRAVNHSMISAYWHIGREMVEALQRGSERAAYGKALIDRLAAELTARYGKGYSATHLELFPPILPGVPRPNSPHTGWVIPRGTQSQSDLVTLSDINASGGC